MGDILGGVFGGGKQTEQTTKPDPQAEAANRLKLQQLQKLFGVSGMSDFARSNTGDFTPSKATQDIINRATGKSNMMTLSDYISLALDEGKGYISKVATPEIMSQLSLQGMDRSGAVPEAIAKATAGVAMPFISTIPSFQNASSQQAQALAGLSDMPRALRAEDFMRRQGVVQTGFTGIPFSPGSTTKGGESSLPLFNMFGMGGSIA
ncbi:MAG: hypothetical protein ACRCZI_14905 [Cetobacterium sp.]